jgi:hypothetical protein
MGRHVDATAAKLDGEEDVEAGQPDGVDGEKSVARDLVSVLADELAPGALSASRSREEVVSAKDLTDGEVEAAVAESEQFALDATVAPAGFSRARRRMSWWSSVGADRLDERRHLLVSGRAPVRPLRAAPPCGTSISLG